MASSAFHMVTRSSVVKEVIDNGSKVKKHRVRDNDCYPIVRALLSLHFIFNWSSFSKSSKLKAREGSEKDASDLQKLYEKFHYSVECFPNLTLKETKSKLNYIATKSQSDNVQLLGITIMSHGDGKDYNSFVTYEGESMSMNFLQDHFSNINCPKLKGKPKLFFPNFCRDKKDATSEVEISPKENFPSDVDVETMMEIDYDHFSSDDAISNIISPVNEDHPEMQNLDDEEDIYYSLTDTDHQMNIMCSPEKGKSAERQNLPDQEDIDYSLTATDNQMNIMCLPEKGKSAERQNLACESLSGKIPYHRSSSMGNWEDMCIIYACMSDCVSYRDPKEGSVMIQSWCKVMKEHGQVYDLNKLYRSLQLEMKTRGEYQKDNCPITCFMPDKTEYTFKPCYLTSLSE